MKNRQQLEDTRDQFFEWLDSVITTTTPVHSARRMVAHDQKYYVATSVAVIDTTIHLYLRAHHIPDHQDVLEMKSTYPCGDIWYDTGLCRGSGTPFHLWRHRVDGRVSGNTALLVALILAVWIELNESSQLE